MTDAPRPRSVTLFGDFTCPFSYVTEAALWRLSERQPLDLSPRAFELFPAPEPVPDPAQDPAALAAALPLAEEAGVVLGTPRGRPRTRKAHEAAAYASRAGAGREMRAAIYRAYWEDGADVGRIDLLMELGEAVGIDSTGLKIALDIDAQRDVVLADLELARRLHITAVPTLYVGKGPEAVVLQGAHEMRALDDAVRLG